MNILIFSIIAVLGSTLLVVGLFRPFLGLLILMTLHFVQPGEMIPALAALRIELFYGILLLLSLLFRKTKEIKDIFRTDTIVRATLLLE